MRWILTDSGTKTIPVLPSGNQERKGQDGFQDLGGPSVERTDCPGGGKEGGLFRGAPGGAGISPLASQWEGAHKPPTTGQSQKLIFQSLPGSGLGQILLSQWTQEWLGRPEVLFSAHQASLGPQLDKRDD